MSIVTIKHARKTFREHQSALQEMFNLFPNATYELECNSYNGRTFEGFKVTIKPKDFAPVAQVYYLSIDELFDFGRPKIIGQRSWVWNSDFLGVSCGWSRKYNFYYQDWEKKYYPISTSIQLQSLKESCGLKDWKKRYSHFLNLMNKNPDKILVQKYRKHIQEANNKVIKWELAMKELSKFQL